MESLLQDSTISKDKAFKQEFMLDYGLVRKSALVFRAVNHKLRQSMIELLLKQGPMVVTDIYVKLRLEQSVASQHLAILRRAGVVKTTRNGKYILYDVSKDRLQQINRISKELTD